MEKRINSKQVFTTYQIVFIALLAAIVYVVTNFRIPLGESKVHFANALCLVSGLLLGPVGGGIAGGLGSAIYDFTAGYGIDEVLVTFLSKFAMAAVAGLIAGRDEKQTHIRVVAGSVIGAWTYVALYMLKTFVYQSFVYSFPQETVVATMLAKLPASAINAAFSMVVAPIIYFALKPVLKRTGLLEKL